ncbi:hypothetical protein ULMA_21280 [Patiriisocius marinus]|uniref:Tetratricopeptide repeat-containing protein n=1 Tax=Patiriisocius marinus TaxID=1397112 RepID=A0A5J4J2B0_9FLAO|nr:tetratricopeptide repeat protein [Patiriisocius marinus]GER60020.1 hypothetical protein ULMA_21280 [Patiriisocius marinus]
MKLLGFTLALLLSVTLSAQDMTTGFTFLETGKYQEAVTYFNDILKDYPDNKTARLCYGRALGLNGTTEKAKTLFTNLKEEYPTDFEVALNYAESLLWNKDYDQAKTFYQTLVLKDTTSFSANLGYANTLSNLKEYDQAIEAVDKALNIQPGNGNALISRKYMKLGKASALKTNDSLKEAITLLKTNFLEFPNDEATQRDLANIYIAQKDFVNAKEAYTQITDSITSLIGISLVEHLDKKDKTALTVSENALNLITAKTDSIQVLSANERYIQALIWNGKYKQAKNKIIALDVAFPENKTVAALKATVGMYTGTFAKSIAEYRQMMEKDSTSFDGNLGIANALRAQGNLKEAYKYAQRTLEFYPNQKDAITLMKTIENSLAPVVESLVSTTSDNGDNVAYTAMVRAEVPFSERFKTTLQYEYRETENETTNTMAYNTSVSLGANYRVLNNTWVESKLGFLKANGNAAEYSDVNGSIFVKSRPLPLQYLEVGYSRMLQNFNADLINQKIFMNNYSLNYNMGTNINLGWYTGLMHTQQTDGNSRNLLFTSLYYSFSKAPAVKGGINYQYLSFKDQVPTVYFSPSIYQAVEVFVEANGSTGKFSYSASAAGGYQFVEDDEATTLFRLEAKATYDFTPRFQVMTYGKYSNSASATASGFEFMELGLKLRWQILEGPLFNL